MEETKPLSLLEKIFEFQKEIDPITKDGQNTFFKKPTGGASTYATLSNILESISPILTKHRLLLTQPVRDGKVFSIITCLDSKEEFTSEIELPKALNAQQSGSAITYFRRYTLISMFALRIEDDDDGSKATRPKTRDGKTKWTEDILNEIALLNTIPELTKYFNQLPELHEDARFTDALGKRKKEIIAAKKS